MIGQDKLQWGGLGDGPLALPDPRACPSQKHKLALIPTGPALGEWGRWCAAPHAVCLQGSAEWGLAGTLVSAQMDPRPARGVVHPSQSLFRRPPPCTRQHPRRRSTHRASLCAVFPSGPFPGASFPGSPLLHCVRAWGLRSRYTYSLCLCAIISVSGGAGLSWGREALSLALLL